MFQLQRIYRTIEIVEWLNMMHYDQLISRYQYTEFENEMEIEFLEVGIKME